ncbi:MAG: Asp-tRNA(Asn)/Glu-tRNA(Gln) amidotransferase subunit GatB [Candidatus Rariloculaceae bacterium]
MAWEIVIGLEIHTQLATKSKIFSGSPTQYGAAPNSQASLVDLGYPGVLPVLNQSVVHMAIKFGLATDCEISRRSVFARKNYFYPDLPKGYQISQYELPIVHSGHLDIVLDDGNIKTIGITRAHLEEDAGKSLHEDFQGLSGIDLNRTGTPLLEIVSEPDLRSAEEAGTYMRSIHKLVRYLGISDGNMQEGSFRCDANVSIRKKGEKKLGTRTELKNLNSFRFVEKAIRVEVERQIDLLEDGGKITQETRLYDADNNETRPMRSKEEANDYRYFPDPDLLPVIINDELIENVRAELPELPNARTKRLIRDHGISDSMAEELTSSPAIADYFEEATKNTPHVPAKRIGNLIQRELSAALNREGLSIEGSKISPSMIGKLAQKIEDNTVSASAASTVFDEIWKTGGTSNVDSIIEKHGLKQITDMHTIEAMVDDVIINNPEQIIQFKNGKEKVIGFLVGQVMKESKGKANPQNVNQLLRSKLSSS